MTILGAFLSTWDDARATFGSGTPVGGSDFDMSGQFHELRDTVLSAAPGGEWTGVRLCHVPSYSHVSLSSPGSPPN